MSPEAIFSVAYMTIGVCVALACVIWLASVSAERPDWVDGMFMALIAGPVAFLWPAVLIGMALTALARKVWDARATANE